MPKNSTKQDSNKFQTLNSGAYCQLEKLIQCRWKAKQFALAPPKSVKSDLAGVYQSRLRGRGVDFSEVRIYQPGDDIRAIDWRVTARTQKTHTKIFQEERERPVILVVDQTSSMFFGSQHCFKSVLAAEIASVIAWSVLSNGDRIGGLVFGDTGHTEIRPKKSKQSVLQLLSSITTFNQLLNADTLNNQSQDLAPILLQTRQVARPGSAIFIISDFSKFSEAAKRQITLLKRHTEILAIHTFDPLEFELPKPGLYSITDGEQRLTLNTFNQHYRHAYESQSNNQLAQLERFFSQQGIPFSSVATHSDYLSMLKTSLMNNRKHRSKEQ